MQQATRHEAFQNENLQNGQEEHVDASLMVNYRKIDEMENFGINKTDILKLKAGGFNTIESVAHSTLKKLQDVKGISEQKAQKLKVCFQFSLIETIEIETNTLFFIRI